MGKESEYISRLSRTKDSITKFVMPPAHARPDVVPIGDYKENEPLEDYAVFFAGHGSPQEEGMERAYRQLAPIENLYSDITRLLGKDLRTLTSDDLKHTIHGQPAIAGTNISACLSHILAHPDELTNAPFAVSGQSAGVLSAGWYADMYGEKETRDAVLTTIQIAQTRGEIQQKIHNNPPSGHMLIAIKEKANPRIDEDKEILNRIREETLPREMPVSLAIDMSDTRFILGGTEDNLKKSRDEYKDRFPDVNFRFFDVTTSCVAFHTDLMKPVEDEIYELFESLRGEMQPPKYPILSNTRKEPILIRTIDEFIEEQVRLITLPVFARDMSKFLKKNGIDTGLEFGERGVIAKSMDGFDITPRAIAIGGAAAVAAGTAIAIGTGYLVKRSRKE